MNTNDHLAGDGAARRGDDEFAGHAAQDAAQPALGPALRGDPGVPQRDVRTANVAVYYARDVLGNANYYIVLTVVSTVGMILASALVPKAVDVAGKKHVYIVAGVIAVASAVGLPWRPGRPRRSHSCATAYSASGWVPSTR